MKRFTRDVAIIALATATSRLFGLFRDVAIADNFGAGTAYDAYIVAFFLPQFLRKLLGEGALALSFIPVYSNYLLKDREEAGKMASNFLNILLLCFPLVIAIGILFAPHFIPFLASGFSPSKQELTIRLTRIVFPFVGFMGLAALMMGILNAHKHFFAPAFAPVFFNIGVISGALYLGNFFERPIFGLASGVLLGGMGQLAFQVPYIRREGFNWRPEFFPLHPGVKRAMRLMVPMVVGLIAAQVNIMVDNKLASYLPAGSISSLQYATRLYQLPLGLFAIAISTAILPRLSDKWSEGSREEFGKMLKNGMELLFFIILPATIGLFVMGKPIVELLFEHRSFTPQDTVRTVYALDYYLVGLLGYSLVQLFTRAFYSIQQTFIPVLAGILAVGVNVGLDLALIGPLGVGGLALATAVSGLVNAAVLMLVFGYMIEEGRFRPGFFLLFKISVSALITGAGVYLCRNMVLNITKSEVALVFIPVLLGVLLYFGLSYLFGSHRVIWEATN